MSVSSLDADLVLVGGGLANGLIAWRLAQCRPRWRVRLLERGDTLGGNHTWSFHSNDLTTTQHAWIAPLVAHRWPCYQVRFPTFRRTLRSGYLTVTSARLHAELSERLGPRTIQLGLPVSDVMPDAVVLQGGARMRCAGTIDGRGAADAAHYRHLRLGWQRFLGIEARLQAPHRLDAPIIMDAGVAQLGGYRFMYVLPLTADVVLIEDTCYADQPELDRAALRERIHQYAVERGWVVTATLREEHGVLPIVLGGDVRAHWDDEAALEQDADPIGGPAFRPGVARSGLRAALFHPATGYSLPDAVRLADRIAALPDCRAETLRAVTRAESFEQWRRCGYFRLLNRLLFRAAAPEQRVRVLARFYRLPEPLIQRFYAGALTSVDKLRILAGRPPVPISRAVRALCS